MIGDKIKRIRKSKKMKQKDLAEKSGLSISYVQQIEYGERKNPSIEVLNQISKALDINLSYLIDDDNPKMMESQTPVYDVMSIREKIRESIVEYSGIVKNISLDNEELESMVDECYKNIEFQFFKLKAQK